MSTSATRAAGAVLAAVLALAGTACDDVVVTKDRHVDGHAADHLDVAVVGDSFAEQSRLQFLALGRGDDLLIRHLALGGTALCDWNGRLDALVAQRPDHLVLSFAGNDTTDCINPARQPRPPSVVAADYRAELERWIHAFRPGTRIHLVAPPPIREPGAEATAAALRRVYDQLADDPAVSVVDTAARLAPDERFETTLPCTPQDVDCGSDGTVTVREGDGIHLTPGGGQRYADAIMDQIVATS